MSRKVADWAGRIGATTHARRAGRGTHIGCRTAQSPSPRSDRSGNLMLSASVAVPVSTICIASCRLQSTRTDRSCARSREPVDKGIGTPDAGRAREGYWAAPGQVAQRRCSPIAGPGATASSTSTCEHTGGSINRPVRRSAMWSCARASCRARQTSPMCPNL